MIMENKIPFTVILIHICTDFLKTMKPFEMMQFKPGAQWLAVQRCANVTLQDPGWDT